LKDSSFSVFVLVIPGCMETVGEVCPSMTVAVPSKVLASLFAFCQAVGQGLDGKGEWVINATTEGLAFEVAFVSDLAGPVAEKRAVA
jgi:hypothetical protein